MITIMLALTGCDGMLGTDADEIILVPVIEPAEQVTCYVDKDDDGFGDERTGVVMLGDDCGDDQVENGDDCDDRDSGSGATVTWYYDKDGDGYGDAKKSQSTCEGQPKNYVGNDEDGCPTEYSDRDNGCEYDLVPIQCEGDDTFTVSNPYTDTAGTTWHSIGYGDALPSKKPTGTIEFIEDTEGTTDMIQWYAEDLLCYNGKLTTTGYESIDSNCLRAGLGLELVGDDDPSIYDLDCDLELEFIECQNDGVSVNLHETWTETKMVRATGEDKNGDAIDLVDAGGEPMYVQVEKEYYRDSTVPRCEFWKGYPRQSLSD